MEALTVVREFLRAENTRNWGHWASYLDPNVTYEVIGSNRVVSGREAYTAHMQRVYVELPDWKFELVSVAAADCVVFVEFLGNGHFSGEYNGRRYERAPLNLTAVCVFELSEGLILAVREYVDHAGYEHQLNLAAPLQPGA